MRRRFCLFTVQCDTAVSDIGWLHDSSTLLILSSFGECLLLFSQFYIQIAVVVLQTDCPIVRVARHLISEFHRAQSTCSCNIQIYLDFIDITWTTYHISGSYYRVHAAHSRMSFYLKWWWSVRIIKQSDLSSERDAKLIRNFEVLTFNQRRRFGCRV